MTLVSNTQEYDPRARGRGQAPASLESVMRLALRTFGQELRVCAPCVVVAVHNRFRVDLQPLQQAKFYAESGPTTLPIIPNAPVAQPGGVAWQVQYPIAVGDRGYAVFADRAIDSLLAGDGSPTDPQSARCHDLTDAIFVPGLAVDAEATQTSDPTSDLVIKNGTAEVRLEQDGQFRIYSGGDNRLEFLDLAGQLTAQCGQLVSVLQSALVNTMLGPQPFLASTQTMLADVAAKLQVIQTSLGKIKGA